MQGMQVRSLGLEDSPGGGNGNPLQYSCLENPTDGGAWWATVHGVTKCWLGMSMSTDEAAAELALPPDFSLEVFTQ